MKFFIHMIIAALLLLIPATISEAFQNEPNGFIDLYWGESLQEIEQNRRCEYDSYVPELNAVKYKVYLKNGEDHTVSGYHISNEILVGLWNNQLTSIGVNFSSTTLSEMNHVYDGLRDAVILNFGEPSKSNDNETIWLGTRTSIMISKNRNNINGVFMILGSSRLIVEGERDGASKGW